MKEQVQVDSLTGQSQDRGDFSVCPDRETLVALFTSTWPVEKGLAEHLENCSSCQGLLEELSDSGALKDFRPIAIKRSQTLPTLGPPRRSGFLGSLGDLDIEEVIGRGGMGIVFRGKDLRLGRDVAVKFLRPGSSPRSEARFIREARAVAALRHDNIVPVYHIGKNSDGQDYIVFPLIPGVTLRERLKSSELDPREAAEIIQQMTKALDCAHAAGLIHRDVKPANILLDRVEQRAKITDFGLVRGIEDSSLTQAEMFCGSPDYMSPEQAGDDEKIDFRSDVYSLGVTLYECLTGSTPFHGRPLEIIDQHRLASPIPPTRLNRAVPVDLETICLKALNKEPVRRYQTMDAFGEDLRRFLAGEPILAKPATAAQKVRLWCRRNPRLAVAIASTIGSLLVGTIVSSLLWLQSTANARESQKLALELGEQKKQVQSALESSELQRLRAEKRFDELRELANELLFEIYPKVEYLENSLEARKTIVTSALSYLDGLHAEAGDDLELQSELATAYEKVGELYGVVGNSHLGDKQAGLANYRKATSLRHAVFKADPTDPAKIERLANNHFVIARTLWMGDDIDGAKTAFDSSLEHQRLLVQLEPRSEVALNKLAAILIESGNVPAWEGQNELAVTIFAEAREILDGLIVRDPKNGEYKKTLTKLLRAKSTVDINIGNLDEGEESLLNAIEIGKQLLEIYPDDFPVARSQWLSKFKLGEFYIRNRMIEKVVPACQAAVEFPTEMSAKEPANAMLAMDLANSCFNLARAFRLKEDFRGSIEQANMAFGVMRKLADAHPGDKEYQRNMAIHLIEIARSYLQLKEYAEVIKPSEQAIEILNPLAASGTSSSFNKYDLSTASRVMAQAHHHLGNRSEALAAIEVSIRLITELEQAGSLSATEQDLLKELVDEKKEFESISEAK